MIIRQTKKFIYSSFPTPRTLRRNSDAQLSFNHLCVNYGAPGAACLLLKTKLYLQKF